ncbi:MAG: aminotransferase class I/II-fold pyridoxal phosphate-dependent enzyme [Bacillota bacterium]|nr:aminotransferase class I/II-fold pyridoxal phosphate-dependent enzyme [Bacillota bacterium]
MSGRNVPIRPEDRLSRAVSGIKPSAIRRFFDLANEMRGQVISLSIGEPDFVTPWPISEQGIYSLEQGRTHYSANTGMIELRQAISAYMKNRFDLSYNAREEIVVTVGGSEAIDAAVRALVNPGDEVLIPEPSFVAYQACVRLAGAVPVPIPLSPETDFRLTAEQLEAAITKKTRLLVMAYPNNPTGAVLEDSDLKALAAVLERYPEVAVLSDELYAELTYPPAVFRSIASYPGMWERTVVIGGFSKAFAMTGWRIGYALGPAPIIAAMNKIHQYVIMCAPTTAQYAAIAALEDAETFIAPMRSEYNRRRRLLLHGLRQLELPCFEPLGAFYAFPDIRSTGLGSGEFCERLLQEEYVAVIPGGAFGSCGEGFIRISYAAALENIEEALRRIARFIGKPAPDLTRPAADA